MPDRIPSLRHHEPSGRAGVTIAGRDRTTPHQSHALSVEKAIPGLFPRRRPQDMPPSRARLAFPGATPTASSGGSLYPQPANERVQQRRGPLEH